MLAVAILLVGHLDEAGLLHGIGTALPEHLEEAGSAGIDDVLDTAVAG